MHVEAALTGHTREVCPIVMFGGMMFCGNYLKDEA